MRSTTRRQACSPCGLSDWMTSSLAPVILTYQDLDRAMLSMTPVSSILYTFSGKTAGSCSTCLITSNHSTILSHEGTRCQGVLGYEAVSSDESVVWSKASRARLPGERTFNDC